jgi:putative hemolysin
MFLSSVFHGEVTAPRHHLLQRVREKSMSESSDALVGAGLTSLDGARHPQPVAGRSQRSHVAPRLEVLWARHLDDVRAAQRLRHEVFVDEMGARPTPVVGAPAGHDIDLFDEFCEHLIVRIAPVNDEPGMVVGTYRVLTPSAARRAGSFYSDTEFDLMRLRPLRERMVELGRSCVHPEHRSGAVILALWGALAHFMEHNAMETVIGCASISMRDGGHCAASLWARLRETHLAPVEWQVRPRVALPVDDLNQSLDVEAPALIKAYLRMGAKVLGAPAWDPAFNTADLPLLTRVADIPERYQRHFLA